MVHLHTELGEHQLGMVARHCRLVDGGGALGTQARQQDRGLQLGRCHGGIVGDGFQLGVAHFHNGKGLASLGLETGAHLHKGRDDAAHGALAQGIVAGDLHADAPGRKNAHQQTGGGAGIAAVDGMVRLRGALLAPAGNAAGKRAVHLALKRYLGSKGGNSADGRAHIGGIEHAGKARGAFGHGGKEHRAMGDRLVAGNAGSALQRTGKGLYARDV